MTQIIPYLFYRDVPAALDFLSRAFGFAEELRTGTPSGGLHAQMTLDGSRIMLGGGPVQHGLSSPAEAGSATQGVFIYIADVDAVHAQAKAAGARLDSPPTDHGYGRTFTAWDPEGHPWYFCAHPA